jgi:hypothetical protein
VSLLADVVVPWDDAVAKGAEAFAREVAAGDRGGTRRRQPVAVGPGGAPVAARTGYGYGNGSGSPNGNGNGHGPAWAGRPAAPTASPASAADPRAAAPGRRPDIDYVSPLRGGVVPDGGPLERAGAPVATLPSIAPAVPVATYPEVPGAATATDRDVEPALPDEARSRVAAEAAATTDPIEAPPAGSVLHVRFGGVPAAQLVSAMEAFRQLARERPGDTRVIVHVPAQGGGALPMELRTGIAYDAELLGEVRRRLGDSVAQLSVAPPRV